MPIPKAFRQVSIRSLCVLLLLVGIVLAYLVHRSTESRRRSAIQREFLNELESADNPVFVVFDADDDNDASTFGPLESSDWFGDYFWGIESRRNIKSVQMMGVTNVSIETFSKLEHFDNLVDLEIIYSETGDDVLAEVSKATSLKCLILSDLPITDHGLKHLKNLVNLERLDLFKMEEIDGDEYEFLQHLTRLKELDLYDSYCSAHAARFVGNCLALEDLRLGHGEFSATELDVVAALPLLKKLNLSDCTIESDLVDGLAKCTRLEYLHLPRSVTQEKLEALQQRLPNCRIRNR